MNERYTYEAINPVHGRPHYRITDTVGDDRVATCFVEENAKAVVAAMNAACRGARKKRTPFVPITGVKLSRDSTHTFVLLEIGGLWVEVIREPILAQYDHIVNVGGIQKAAYEAHWQQAEDDLAASGGIVDAP